MEAAQSLLAMRPYKQLNLYSIYICVLDGNSKGVEVIWLQQAYSTLRQQ